MPAIGKKSSISQAIKARGLKSTRKASEPLWKGPLEDGITQSLLSEFLVCPDRFRVKVIDGLSFDEGFSQRLEYGSMWHVCEEYLALGSAWEGPLKDYCKGLCVKYPLQQQQIVHWYNVCKVQFPIYVDWWKKHNDVKHRTPLMQEVSFKVPYTLPSGRVVTLRGKWDSVDVIGKGKEAAVYLQENKTKGDIDAPLLRRMLSSGFELQTMIYLVALMEAGTLKSNQCFSPDSPYALLSEYAEVGRLAGVRYNVIRRPLSGGIGSIKQRQPTQGSKCPKCRGEGVFKDKLAKVAAKCPKCLGAKRVDAKQGETDEEFYARLGGIIRETIEENGDHYFFMRWKVDISAKDIQRFKDECLNPILERLCNWWELMTVGKPTFPELGIHYRMPYGLYNPMAEGRVDDVDAYLLDGNEVGMRRLETLFPELDQ